MTDKEPAPLTEEELTILGQGSQVPSAQQRPRRLKDEVGKRGEQEIRSLRTRCEQLKKLLEAEVDAGERWQKRAEQAEARVKELTLVAAERVNPLAVNQPCKTRDGISCLTHRKSMQDCFNERPTYEELLKECDSLKARLEEAEEQKRQDGITIELLVKERDQAKKQVADDDEIIRILTIERDRARAEVESMSASLRSFVADRDEWRGRAEAAEADLKDAQKRLKDAGL